ncbi:MAG: hypothetical protein M0036_14180 [Desulfobacteraceae bacterium]|nr:hypothetical protein [Desulfobacteraceae bacterium]
MDRYAIQHASTGMGSSDFTVYDRAQGREFRIRYRFALDEYQASIYNGPAAEYQRDIVGSLYIANCGGEPMSRELFEAFCAHLQADWDKFLATCEVYKAKYPGDAEVEKIWLAGPACPIVKAGYWDQGWHVLNFGSGAA